SRQGGGGLLQHHLQLFAAGLVEDLRQGGVCGEVDGEGLQCLVDGVVAVVGNRADVTAAEVLQDHALEQVVNVLHGEGEVHPGVSLHRSFPLEVTDAAAK